MKQKVVVWALALLLLLLPGCGEAAATDGDSPPEGPVVCASFYVMADFSRKIGGDRIQVIDLAPAGGEPHDWEPTPQEIAQLEKADLLVINGLGFEHWVDRVVPTLENGELRVVDSSVLLSTLRESGHAHAHGEENDHGTVTMDPHIWLSPQNARLQMHAICAALVSADPEGKGVYEANLERWAKECEALDEAYREGLDGLPRREIVVAHGAFGYLCDAYGLEQVAVQGLAPEGEPDPSQMAAIIDFIAAHDVTTIFFEHAASPKVAKAIAREAGVEIAVLNPLESLSEEQVAAGGDYFSVMEENLVQLRAALG